MRRQADRPQYLSLSNHCCIHIPCLNSSGLCLFWTQLGSVVPAFSIVSFFVELLHRKQTKQTDPRRRQTGMWFNWLTIYFRLCVCLGTDFVSRGRGRLPESGCVSETKIHSGASTDQGQLQAHINTSTEHGVKSKKNFKNVSFCIKTWFTTVYYSHHCLTQCWKGT